MSTIFESAISESELLAKVPDRMFIGGDWVESTSGRAIEVQDPATGLVIKTIADASVADGTRAMDAAVAAQRHQFFIGRDDGFPVGHGGVENLPRHSGAPDQFNHDIDFGIRHNLAPVRRADDVF